MKDQAQVVIVGGGIVGANVAYHLAKLGWKDVVLFEKGEIASGESSHGALQPRRQFARGFEPGPA
jgi:glycine/D-amino acid oxidase-like deaminating enzyme